MKRLISKVMLIITVIAVFCIISLGISKGPSEEKEERCGRTVLSTRNRGMMMNAQMLC